MNMQFGTRPAATNPAARPFWLMAGLMTAGCTMAAGLSAQQVEIPAAEEVILVTSDYVQLYATWLPGIHEKETLPVIMLHGWGGGQGNDKDRSSLLKMAEYLQANYGFAVLVPDLRGHGKSISLENSTPLPDRDRWRADQITAMIEDIEACKKFLLQKNNEGQLNIDLLSIVAEDELSMHAAIWTLRDWSYLPIAGRKQGQDVKALALIDPVRSFRGVNANNVYRRQCLPGKLEPVFQFWLPMAVGIAGMGHVFTRPGNEAAGHWAKMPTNIWNIFATASRASSG